MFRILTGLVMLVSLPGLINIVNAERFDHSSGLGFDYPKSWQLAEQENFLTLTPPGQSGSQADELVLIGAESIAGVSSLTDPSLLQWFDQQMIALLGTAQRSEPPTSGSSGVMLDYKSSDGRQHRVRYRNLAGLGAYVAHIGVTQKHEDAVGAIFTSLGGTLAFDPALVGSWHRSKTSMTDVDYDQSGNSSYASSHADIYYSFDDRNKVVYESNSAIYAQGSSGGGTSSVSSIGENPASYGTYSANGSQITIIWDDGTSTEWNYRVFPHQGSNALKLINPDTEKHSYYTLMP